MRNLQHLKGKRTRKPKTQLYKLTAGGTQDITTSFVPPKVEAMQCGADSDRALWDFKCTRLKLLNILRRHERIASILMDVKHRIEPIRFLLTTADERNMLSAENGKKAVKSVDDVNNLALCGLILHNFEVELKVNQVLQYSLDELKELDLLGEERFAKGLKEKGAATVDEGSSNWTKIITDWNQMDEANKLNFLPSKGFASELKGNINGEHIEQQLKIKIDQVSLGTAENRDWQAIWWGFTNIDKTGAILDVVKDNSQDNVGNGDWKKILNELNDWCVRMDGTPTPDLDTSLSASTFSANSLN